MAVDSGERVGTERATPRLVAVARSTPGVPPTEFLNLKKPSYLPTAPGPIDRRGLDSAREPGAPSTRPMSDRDIRPAIV